MAKSKDPALNKIAIQWQLAIPGNYKQLKALQVNSVSVMSSSTEQYDIKGGWASNADLYSEMKFQLIFGEILMDKRAYVSILAASRRADLRNRRG